MTAFRLVFAALFLFSIKFCDAEYKLKLVSLKICKLPESKLDKDNQLDLHISSRKVSRFETIILGNYTVKQKLGPLYMTFRSYQVKQNLGRELAFRVEKVDCKKPLAMQFLAIAKIQLDKDCFLEKGSYQTRTFGINDFSWILTAALSETGRYSYDLEFVTDKGIVGCIEMSCDVIKK